MIEYCTEEDSQLGQVASERPDAKNIRITRKDADLSKKTGLDYALKIADENPGADLWGSLPCTAVSALQNGYVGRAGSQHWAKLDCKRRNLKKLVETTSCSVDASRQMEETFILNGLGTVTAGRCSHS